MPHAQVLASGHAASASFEEAAVSHLCERQTGQAGLNAPEVGGALLLHICLAAQVNNDSAGVIGQLVQRLGRADSFDLATTASEADGNEGDGQQSQAANHQQGVVQKAVCQAAG